MFDLAGKVKSSHGSSYISMKLEVSVPLSLDSPAMINFIARTSQILNVASHFTKTDVLCSFTTKEIHRLLMYWHRINRQNAIYF